MNNKFWLTHSYQIIFFWIVLTVFVGTIGYISGINSVIPGPANKKTLMSNPGENSAYLAGIPPKDSLVLVVGHKAKQYDHPDSVLARNSIVDLLKNLEEEKNKKVFIRIETVDNIFLDADSFISNDNLSSIIKAHSNHSIDVSADEFKNLPVLFQKWQKSFPDFSLNYLSYGTVNNEMFDLIHKDLDNSLFFSIPITFLILLWAFGSLVSAFIPLLVAGLSLILSLGITAILSHFVGAVSATASQLVVLLVLAIGIDYSHS